MPDLAYYLEHLAARLRGRGWDRLAALERAAARRPDSPRALWRLAMARFWRGDYAAAEPLLRRLIALAPGYREAPLRLAQAIERCGRLDEAFPMYQEILARDPKVPHAAFGVGHILSVRGEFAGAIPWFERAWANKADYAEAVHRIGQCHAALGDRERALAFHHRALEVNPVYAEAALAIARNHLAAGAVDAAEDYCRRAARFKPDYAEAVYALSEVYDHRQDHAQAREFARRALEMKPDYVEAMAGVAKSCNALGEPRQAIAIVRRALDLKPDCVEAMLEMVKIHVALEEPGPAGALTRRALELKPDCAEAMLVLGSLRAASGDLDGAAALLSQVAALEPPPLSCFRPLAEVRFLQGDCDAALAALLRGLNLTEAPRRAPPRAAIPAAGPGALPAGPVMGRAIAVATSLMPRRLEVQRAAVTSWRALGFEVLSVNVADEIRALAPSFPDIRFVEPAATAERLCGRPMIPIDELMTALEATGRDICGIVNSDIVIGDDPAFRRAIEREAGGSLVFGHRVDVPSLESPAGKTFTGGYDFFFFEPSAIPCFTGTGLVLGMPWWDFWPPIAARLAGLAVKRLEAPMVRHQTHPVGYQETFFHSFCREFLDSTGRLIGRCPDGTATPADALMRRLYGTLADAFDPPHRDKAFAIGTICAFTTFLINRTAIPVTVAEAGKAAA